MQSIDFRDVKVLITGHTGFKGTWLSRILSNWGAEVSGISLRPEVGSLFARTKGMEFRNSRYIDINDRKKIEKVIVRDNPDILIHMAAQPLVRRSYREPVETFETNVMGTAHVLDASLKCANLIGVIAITTDKVYRNVEKFEGYHEDEPLGGKDPYSASKSGSEMVVTAWRNLSKIKSGPQIVAARSGNVIGGGDHAQDRLLPDLIRGFINNQKVEIRNPNSLRPWQHVLDPLFGYLSIASHLLKGLSLQGAYNFGPEEKSKLKVSDMADIACNFWPNNQGWTHAPISENMPESNLLWLSSERSKKELRWRNKLGAKEAIKWTIDWELMARDRGPLVAIDSQIERYLQL